MNLILSMFACFVAIQAGTQVVCVGAMVVEQGLIGAVDGLGLWGIGQFAILPVALIEMPFGTLVRFILGELFEEPREVAFIAGLAIGLISTAGVLTASGVPLVPDALFWIGVGALAGLTGGWTWWRVERKYLAENKK